MSLVMRSKPKREYLTILVSGTFELEQANQLMPRILDLCAANRASKLLIDARGVEGSMSIADRFVFAETFARLYKKRRVAGNFKHVQFTVVVTRAIFDPQKFGEKVATNRGLQVKVTTDMKEALAWLGISKPDSAYRSGGEKSMLTK
jgi:hypothetical protein